MCLDLIILGSARRTFLKIGMVGVFATAAQLNKDGRDDDKHYQKYEQHNHISQVHDRLNPFLKRR